MLPPFTPNVWDEDLDMVNLRIHFKSEIKTVWDKGIRAYVGGDWFSAMSLFKKVLELTHGKDGPSKHLLTTMEKHSFKVPVDWKGFTAL
jgi:hypothetical protein